MKLPVHETIEESILSFAAQFTVSPQRLATEIEPWIDPEKVACEIDMLVADGSVIVRHGLVHLTPAGVARVESFNPEALRATF